MSILSGCFLAQDRDQWRAVMNFGFVKTWLREKIVAFKYECRSLVLLTSNEKSSDLIT